MSKLTAIYEETCLKQSKKDRQTVGFILELFHYYALYVLLRKSIGNAYAFANSQAIACLTRMQDVYLIGIFALK